MTCLRHPQRNPQQRGEGHGGKAHQQVQPITLKDVGRPFPQDQDGAVLSRRSGLQYPIRGRRDHQQGGRVVPLHARQAQVEALCAFLDSFFCHCPNPGTLSFFSIWAATLAMIAMTAI